MVPPGPLMSVPIAPGPRSMDEDVLRTKVIEFAPGGMTVAASVT